ncbi:MAG: hypothetical protein K940chlam9_01319 [Chlamydiae bacterium]|nr:hypothetical protein [Chlamydiota bacterium]
MKLITNIAIGLLSYTSLNVSAYANPNSSLHAPATPQGPSIQVLLAQDVPSALLEVKGNYRVVEGEGASPLSSGNSGKRFVVHAINGGLRWGEEYPGVKQISVLSQNQDTCVYVNGIQYKGAITVLRGTNNRVTLVNAVPIEEFMKSTLAIRFSEKGSNEAMAAMVIAARTEAYNLVQRSLGSSLPWNTTAEKAHYYGYGVTGQNNQVDALVDETRFMVLSSSTDTTLTKLPLSLAKAEKLAEAGCDAKKILTTAFPSTQISLTIPASSLALK